MGEESMRQVSGISETERVNGFKPQACFLLLPELSAFCTGVTLPPGQGKLRLWRWIGPVPHALASQLITAKHRQRVITFLAQGLKHLTWYHCIAVLHQYSIAPSLHTRGNSGVGTIPEIPLFPPATNLTVAEMREMLPMHPFLPLFPSATNLAVAGMREMLPMHPFPQPPQTTLMRGLSIKASSGGAQSVWTFGSEVSMVPALFCVLDRLQLVCRWGVHRLESRNGAFSIPRSLLRTCKGYRASRVTQALAARFQEAIRRLSNRKFGPDDELYDLSHHYQLKMYFQFGPKRSKTPIRKSALVKRAKGVRFWHLKDLSWWIGPPDYRLRVTSFKTKPWHLFW
eukprot:1161040-Pelagomonas_calceolata.AAC.4